jgi:hypothetical protein
VLCAQCRAGPGQGPQCAHACVAAAPQSKDQTWRLVPLGMIVASRYVTLILRAAGVGLHCAKTMRHFLAMEILVVRRVVPETRARAGTHTAAAACARHSQPVRLRHAQALGGVANAFYFPEKFFPGKLDCFVTSHQIMHVCTGTAAGVFLTGMRSDYSCWRAENR